MNVLLWVLQGFGALVFGASGVMKIFMFEKISADQRSFDVLPREVWTSMGVLELICTVGLIAPAALHWKPVLTPIAAATLAAETLVFIGVHVKTREVGPMVMSAVLGLIMAFLAYGRFVLKPIE